MTIEAKETDFTTADVPEDELWNVSEFKDYKIKLINNVGRAEIMEFEKWINKEDAKKKVRVKQAMKFDFQVRNKTVICIVVYDSFCTAFLIE